MLYFLMDPTFVRTEYRWGLKIEMNDATESEIILLKWR